MGYKKEFSEIYKYIGSLPVFSDHCHHHPDSFFSQKISLDTLINNSYVSWTGFTCKGTIESRKMLLENAGFNTYFTWLNKGIQKAHNIKEEISLQNWNAVSDKITKAYADNKNFHWESLKNNGFEKIILDAYWNPGDDNGHPEIFTPAFRIDKFMYGYHIEAVAPNNFIPWEKYSFRGKNLDEFVEMMKAKIKEQFDKGKVVALKCAEAYNRNICFLPDEKESAGKIFGIHPSAITPEQTTIFGNYIFNRCCELAEELDIPFQIHTGLARLSGSQPMNLEPVIAKYPKVRFVLFHSGFPWIHQVAGLTHNYKNAFPSLTWTATICTSAAIRALHDYIDVANSINTITWGDDCWVPEESIGALLAWRFIVATVLTERILDGRISGPKAELLARKLMFENGRSVYLRKP